MNVADDELPTQQEAEQAFWDVIGPALIDLIRQGKLDPHDLTHDDPEGPDDA